MIASIRYIVNKAYMRATKVRTWHERIVLKTALMLATLVCFDACAVIIIVGSVGSP